MPSLSNRMASDGLLHLRSQERWGKLTELDDGDVPGSVCVNSAEPLPQPRIQNPIISQRVVGFDPLSATVVDRGRTHWGSAPAGGPEGGG